MASLPQGFMTTEQTIAHGMSERSDSPSRLRRSLSTIYRERKRARTSGSTQKVVSDTPTSTNPNPTNEPTVTHSELQTTEPVEMSETESHDQNEPIIDVLNTEESIQSTDASQPDPEVEAPPIQQSSVKPRRSLSTIHREKQQAAAAAAAAKTQVAEGSSAQNLPHGSSTLPRNLRQNAARQSEPESENKPSSKLNSSDKTQNIRAKEGSFKNHYLANHNAIISPVEKSNIMATVSGPDVPPPPPPALTNGMYNGFTQSASNNGIINPNKLRNGNHKHNPICGNNRNKSNADRNSKYNSTKFTAPNSNPSAGKDAFLSELKSRVPKTPAHDETDEKSTNSVLQPIDKTKSLPIKQRFSFESHTGNGENCDIANLSEKHGVERIESLNITKSPGGNEPKIKVTGNRQNSTEPTSVNGIAEPCSPIEPAPQNVTNIFTGVKFRNKQPESKNLTDDNFEVTIHSGNGNFINKTSENFQLATDLSHQNQQEEATSSRSSTVLENIRAFEVMMRGGQDPMGDNVTPPAPEIKPSTSKSESAAGGRRSSVLANIKLFETSVENHACEDVPDEKIIENKNNLNDNDYHTDTINFKSEIPSKIINSEPDSEVDPGPISPTVVQKFDYQHFLADVKNCRSSPSVSQNPKLNIFFKPTSKAENIPNHEMTNGSRDIPGKAISTSDSLTEYIFEAKKTGPTSKSCDNSDIDNSTYSIMNNIEEISEVGTVSDRIKAWDDGFAQIRTDPEPSNMTMAQNKCVDNTIKMNGDISSDVAQEPSLRDNEIISSEDNWSDGTPSPTNDMNTSTVPGSGSGPGRSVNFHPTPSQHFIYHSDDSDIGARSDISKDDITSPKFDSEHFNQQVSRNEQLGAKTKRTQSLPRRSRHQPPDTAAKVSTPLKSILKRPAKISPADGKTFGKQVGVEIKSLTNDTPGHKGVRSVDQNHGPSQTVREEIPKSPAIVTHDNTALGKGAVPNYRTEMVPNVPKTLTPKASSLLANMPSAARTSFAKTVSQSSDDSSLISYDFKNEVVSPKVRNSLPTAQKPPINQRTVRSSLQYDFLSVRRNSLQPSKTVETNPKNVTSDGSNLNNNPKFDYSKFSNSLDRRKGPRSDIKMDHPAGWSNPQSETSNSDSGSDKSRQSGSYKPRFSVSSGRNDGMPLLTRGAIEAAYVSPKWQPNLHTELELLPTSKIAMGVKSTDPTTVQRDSSNVWSGTKLIDNLSSIAKEFDGTAIPQQLISVTNSKYVRDTPTKSPVVATLTESVSKPPTTNSTMSNVDAAGTGKLNATAHNECIQNSEIRTESKRQPDRYSAPFASQVNFPSSVRNNSREEGPAKNLGINSQHNVVRAETEEKIDVVTAKFNPAAATEKLECLEKSKIFEMSFSRQFEQFQRQMSDTSLIGTPVSLDTKPRPKPPLAYGSPSTSDSGSTMSPKQVSPSSSDAGVSSDNSSYPKSITKNMDNAKYFGDNGDKNLKNHNNYDINSNNNTANYNISGLVKKLGCTKTDDLNFNNAKILDYKSQSMSTNKQTSVVAPYRSSSHLDQQQISAVMEGLAQVGNAKSEYITQDSPNDASPCQAWDPTLLLKNLYRVDYNPVQRVSAYKPCPEVIAGPLEHLPLGIRDPNTTKATWRTRYFQVIDGRLMWFSMINEEKIKLGELRLAHCQINSFPRSQTITILGGMDNAVLTLRCNPDDLGDWKTALTAESSSTQQTDTFVRPVQPRVSSNDPRCVIIELGSCSIRAGVFTEEPSLPQLFFPCAATLTPNGSTAIGFDAYLPEHRLVPGAEFVSPITPTQPGQTRWYFMDLPVIAKIFRSIFDLLKVSSKNSKVLLSIPQNSPPKLIGDLAKILLNDFGAAGVALVKQPILVLYAYDVTTGIVVDLGDRLNIVPVVDGYVVESGIVSLPYGGQKLSDVLRFKLLDCNPGLYTFMNPVEQMVLRYIKETACYLADDYAEECEKYTQSPNDTDVRINLEQFEPLPEMSSEVLVDSGRFTSAEGLVAPKRWGVDICGLPKLIFGSVQAAPIDSRRDLYKNIYLAGGASLVPGLANRIQAELSTMVASSIKIQVHASQHRYHAAYVGAQVLASSQQHLSQQLITTDTLNSFISQLYLSPM